MVISVDDTDSDDEPRGGPSHGQQEGESTGQAHLDTRGANGGGHQHFAVEADVANVDTGQEKPPWTIRSWANADLESLSRFTLGRHSYGVPSTIQAAARNLGNFPYLQCFIAVEEDTSRLLGAVVFDAIDGEQGYIEALGVVKDRRYEGIGTTLKTHAMEAFIEIGAPSFYSMVRIGNRPMQNINEHQFYMVGVPDGLYRYAYYGMSFVEEYWQPTWDK